MKIVLVVIAVVLVVLGGYSVWALTHPTTLRTEIEIPASPDAVWDVLADRTRTPSGTRSSCPRPATWWWAGSRTCSRTAQARSRRSSPAAGGRAGTRAALDREGRVRRIFDGEHAFRIEPAGPGRVRFIQEERFRGVAVPVMRGWLNDKIKPQFDAMNTALATRVQSR